MPTSTRHSAATLVVSLLLMLTFISGCGGEDGATRPAGNEDPASFVQAAVGPHRYSVIHENLGTCTGAAADGEETLEITFGPDGLTLTNLDYEWTEDFEQVAVDQYYRLESFDGAIEWHQTLTLTADGFILYSETNDPNQVGEGNGVQPCLRYTYTRLD